MSLLEEQKAAILAEAAITSAKLPVKRTTAQRRERKAKRRQAKASRKKNRGKK